MPRSNGIFTLVASYFATAGQTIRTEQHNPPLEDIAQGLTDSLPRDGTAAMTGNLPMGGRKITGLGAATAPADAVRFDQLPAVTVQSGPYDTTAGALLTPGSFGLGLVSAAVAVADIDLTTRASGTQRYEAGAVGTFPTGVTAATQGKSTLVRGNATQAYEVLQPNTADNLFWRRLATTWQAWQQIISVPDSTVADGDMLARIGGVWSRLAKGAAGQVLRQNDAVTAPEWASSITSRGAQSTATGTEFDFLTIPDWARHITVNINGVSLSGSENPIVQLGTASGFVATGYNGGGAITTGGGSTYTTSTDGLLAPTGNSGEALFGRMEISRVGASNVWVASFNGATNARASIGGGSIALAAALTQLRLTRTGADTFDAGSVSISYE